MEFKLRHFLHTIFTLVIYTSHFLHTSTFELNLGKRKFLHHFHRIWIGERGFHIILHNIWPVDFKICIAVKFRLCWSKAKICFSLFNFLLFTCIEMWRCWRYQLCISSFFWKLINKNSIWTSWANINVLNIRLFKIHKKIKFCCTFQIIRISD